jgi:hypothetical protein
VACLAHFQGEPLAGLAPAAAAGPAALRAAAAALPEPLRASAARRLGLAGRGPATLAAAVAEALAARGRWALALAWTHAAARAVGHRASARPQLPRPRTTRGGAHTLQLMEWGSAGEMRCRRCARWRPAQRIQGRPPGTGHGSPILLPGLPSCVPRFLLPAT